MKRTAILAIGWIGVSTIGTAAATEKDPDEGFDLIGDVAGVGTGGENGGGSPDGAMNTSGTLGGGVIFRFKLDEKPERGWRMSLLTKGDYTSLMNITVDDRADLGRTLKAMSVEASNFGIGMRFGATGTGLKRLKYAAYGGIGINVGFFFTRVSVSGLAATYGSNDFTPTDVADLSVVGLNVGLDYTFDVAEVAKQDIRIAIGVHGSLRSAIDSENTLFRALTASDASNDDGTITAGGVLFALRLRLNAIEAFGNVSWYGAEDPFTKARGIPGLTGWQVTLGGTLRGSAFGVKFGPGVQERLTKGWQSRNMP